MHPRSALHLAVAAVILAACTVDVTGQATPGAAGTTLPPVPVIPVEPAVWAMSALDPCALVADAPVAAQRPPFASKPHNCAVDHRGRDGRPARLVVRVGVAFDTASRARAAPVTIAGLTAYQLRDEDRGIYDPPVCRVDIPISAQHSIQVEADAARGPLETACAGAREAAAGVAAKLGSPGAFARTTPPAALGRRHACDVLEAALGYVAHRDGPDNPHADACRAVPPGTDPVTSPPSVQFEAESGPDTPGEPGPGDSMVDLPLGPALLRPLPDLCEVAFVAERQPGAPAEHAAQIVTITHRDSPGDPCADALGAATEIQKTLSAPAPEPPPAPARLGFAEGEPDDVMPVACGLYGNTTPGTCRTPVAVHAPTTAPAVLAATDAGPGNPQAPDVSCAILRGVAAPVVGAGIELAALANGGCAGLAPDGYAVRLGFHAHASVDEHCNSRTLERAQVQVAGRPAVRCGESSGTGYSLVLPATAPDAPGVVLVEGTLRPPRGERRDDRPADEARLVELTDRITTNVVERHLSG